MNINDYQTERSCEYRGERYLVRDNGAVFRYPRNKKKRRLDEEWTFGQEHPSSKYMLISSALVHQIVATAFHGPAPAEYYVVDHIDENKQNNRPENLRWTTRRGNILQNPITVKKIDHICGSAEAFLAAPENFYHLFPKAKKSTKDQKGELLYRSLTSTAKQRNWKAPALFPQCPASIEKDPINAYFDCLEIGKVFSSTQYRDTRVVSLVFDFQIINDQIILLSHSERLDGGNPWAIAKVYFENNFYIHESVCTCPTLEEAAMIYMLEENEMQGECRV